MEMLASTIVVIVLQYISVSNRHNVYLNLTNDYMLTIPQYREGNDTPLQYSCLENAMDGGAWWAAVHGVTKSQTRLSDCTFTFDFHALEKEMATHSSALAWRIPGTGEPGGLPSLESHRVGHNWSNLAAAPAAATYLNKVGKGKIVRKYIPKL